MLRSVVVTMLLGALVVLGVACGEDAETTAELEAQSGGLEVNGEPVFRYYQRNCASCHGTDRQGVVGPALTPERLTESDELYFETIKHGRAGTGMPAFNRLSDEEIQALVTFIKTVDP